jgi:anti-anti-sigma factor
LAIQRWSEDTLVVGLSNDPELSDDVAELQRALSGACCDVVLDLSDLDLVTSGGIAALLKTRKRVHETGRRLILCSVRDTVWSALLNTGLDPLFEFAANVSEALARLEGGKR